MLDVQYWKGELKNESLNMWVPNTTRKRVISIKGLFSCASGERDPSFNRFGGESSEPVNFVPVLTFTWYKREKDIQYEFFMHREDADELFDKVSKYLEFSSEEMYV